VLALATERTLTLVERRLVSPGVRMASAMTSVVVRGPLI
jgi:hypothetical protein